ncbi:alpha-L-fucosidase [Lysobacter sp. BMK333-48F3]|uniref:alpha-L-fucosidase n=1 Tax=Lysobacter sp. BMK333-48F3 TaxID=2867962 RepID=UPI0021023341|nr:alpha-L-fucosidase [Lysobacter sp. BMK333-48F3]
MLLFAMDRRRFLLATSASALAATAPPLATASEAATAVARPRPTPQQLAWQREELSMFVHFTVNTFTDREWGEGDEDPRVFAPSDLDAGQWARAAKAGGFRSLILTAKHHDGFCLWPTATTEHCVRNSPWRGGRGDVVREFVDACRGEGLAVGFYLSPWDRNEPRYGRGRAYDDFYIAQLTELLTGYGPVHEVWFDGANGEGPNGKRQAYDWPRIHRTVRELQPQAIVFSDAGPDVRWIGNERGIAGHTCWSTVDPGRVPHAGFDRPWVGDALQQGDPYGTAWRPGESDVSIRPGWFWHAAEDAKVRTPEQLLALYFASVGRNSKLLLNVPPTRSGRFHDADVAALAGFARLREAVFGAGNWLAGARVRASGQARGHAPERVLEADPDTYWSAPRGARTGWIEFESAQDMEFDTLCLQEAIAHGQHIANYRIERWHEGRWQPFAWGTTIGHKRLERFDPLRARRVRLTIEHAYDTPRLSAFGLYRSAT